MVSTAEQAESEQTWLQRRARGHFQPTSKKPSLLNLRKSKKHFTCFMPNKSRAYHMPSNNFPNKTWFSKQIIISKMPHPPPHLYLGKGWVHSSVCGSSFGIFKRPQVSRILDFNSQGFHYWSIHKVDTRYIGHLRSIQSVHLLADLKSSTSKGER